MHIQLREYIERFFNFFSKIQNIFQKKFDFVICLDPDLATAADVAPTKNVEARDAGLLHMSQQPCRFSQVSLGAFLLPRFLRLRIQRDIHCTNKNCFKSRVKVPLRKKLRSVKLGVFRL